jgi:hypothetical protein
LIGALALAIAAIATADVIRPLRWLNAVLGVWLIVAPRFLAGAGSPARWNDALVGLALLLLSLRRGTLHERYAGWDRYIR